MLLQRVYLHPLGLSIISRLAIHSKRSESCRMTIFSKYGNSIICDAHTGNLWTHLSWSSNSIVQKAQWNSKTIGLFDDWSAWKLASYPQRKGQQQSRSLDHFTMLGGCKATIGTFNSLRDSSESNTVQIRIWNVTVSLTIVLELGGLIQKCF